MGVAFWDTATALQRPDAAAPALARAIRRLSAGDSLPTALGYWTELKGLVPGALVDPTTLLRFVPALRKEARSAEASRALRDAVDPANRGLMPPQAVRVAELARESDPAVALAAAKLALASPDLPAPTRARLEQLAGLEGTAAVAPPVPVPVPAPKPASAPAPAAKTPGDRTLELELDPMLETDSVNPANLAGAALEARWSDVKVAEAVPTALDDNGARARAARRARGPPRAARRSRRSPSATWAASARRR